MTRRCAALAIGAVLASAGMASAAADRPDLTRKPALVVGALYPLTVQGASFRPYERVTVTLRAANPHVRRVVATRTGTFTVRFAVRLGRCTTATIRAVGTQGSRLVMQVPRPSCRDAGEPTPS